MKRRRWELAALGLLGLAGVCALTAAARRRSYSFRSRTVIITGGSRGLGLELAREFAREGAQLALLARDVRDYTQVGRNIERVAACFGRIDVLVNNAGIIQREAQPSEGDRLDAWIERS